MKTFPTHAILPTALAVAAVVALLLWLNTGPGRELAARVPGLDRPLATGAAEKRAAPVPGEPVMSEGKPSDLPGSWPCFRGLERDGICHDSVPLARKWPADGPEVLWTVELGPGHAGAAVSDGRVYVLDYDLVAQADTMRCLSLDDGREIWRNGYPVEVVENHGMSRTVPAVFEDCALSIGPKCHVACWDAETGHCRWLLDLALEYKATVPTWYTGQCPLIDRGRVILAPAGDALMMAVDCHTGEILWKSPKVRNWEMTHVSVAAMEFAGRAMYVYCGSKGVAAVSADDGSLLWESTDWVGKMATCPTPVPLGDGRVFFCGGYNAGSVMLGLAEHDGQIVPQTLFRLQPKQFDSEQHTPIFFDNHLFGVRTRAGREQLACIDLEGNEKWNSGADKFGRGPYLFADGLIYVMNDEGLLTVAEASTEEYKPLDTFHVFENAYDSWGPMALASGRLIVRDLTRMACLDVSAK